MVCYRKLVGEPFNLIAIKSHLVGSDTKRFFKYRTAFLKKSARERSGSVVECLTRDRRAAGSSLIGVTALWSLSKTHLS